MPLTDTEVKSFKPEENRYRRSDGGGLFIDVMPSGKKVFRLAYRHDGKQRTAWIGDYPTVCLAEARLKVSELKLALLAGLRADGYALGVATNDSERSALLQLDIAGAAGAFDFVAGYDSGHGMKPEPGVLLAFAAATGLAPGEVVMVGDSRHDLELARNAGAAMAVAVLTGPAKRDDLAPHADHVLPSIEHLPALLADRRG